MIFRQVGSNSKVAISSSDPLGATPPRDCCVLVLYIVMHKIEDSHNNVLKVNKRSNFRKTIKDPHKGYILSVLVTLFTTQFSTIFFHEFRKRKIKNSLF